MDRLTSNLVALTTAIFLFMLAPTVQAADLSVRFVMPVAQIRAGDLVSVDVLLTNLGSEINAVDLTLRYSEALTVTDISRAQSALTLWPEPPSTDLAGRTVHLVGGVPNGLYAKDARVATILFTATAPGNATITLTKDLSGGYLNDGLGTRVALPPVAANITVVSDFSPSIVVTSPTHPDLNSWSRTRTVQVNWTPAADTEYSYAFSRDGQTAPDTVPETTIGSVSYDNLADGRYAFLISASTSPGEWSPVSQRWFFIDGTPPEPFTLTQIDPDSIGGARALSWSAVDAASEVIATARIGDLDVGAVQNPLTIRPEWANRKIVITLTDQAGNYRSATWMPPAAPPDLNLLPIIGFIVMIVGLLAALRWVRRRR